MDGSQRARRASSPRRSSLSTLTAFNNRHYRSTTGAEAAVSIPDTATTTASSAGRADDVSVSQFTHSNFAQRSVIAKVAGADPDAPVVILGSHLNSIGGNVNARAPGADDDGSGRVTLLEAFRALPQNGYAPRVPKCSST